MKRVVHKDLSLLQLLRILYREDQTPVTLIACVPRETFDQQVLWAIGRHENGEYVPDNGTLDIFKPTIKNLIRGSEVRIMYCENVEMLHACLAALEAPETSKEGSEPPALWLMNLVALHRRAEKLTAQALGRAFSAAVEAAYAGSQSLHFVELSEVPPWSSSDGNDNNDEDELNELDLTSSQQQGRDASTHDDPSTTSSDIWATEIPLISENTKSFGLSGEKPWIGRKVPISSIALRWCTFSDSQSI